MPTSFCGSCGSKLNENSKFCSKCGATVVGNMASETKHESVSSTKADEKVTSDIKKKKNQASNWFLWWQIDKEELNKQVDQYHTLKITQSARGISFLCLLFSAVLTALMILFFEWDSSAYFDAFIALIIGLLVLKGYKWAMIMAMIFWTLEKIYVISTQFSGSSGATTYPLASLIWWATYMHAFYLAYKVEKLRITNYK